MDRVKALLNECNREFTTRTLNNIDEARLTAKGENWLPLLKAYTGADSQVVSFDVITEKKPNDSIVLGNIDTFVDWMRGFDNEFGLKYRLSFKCLYCNMRGDVEEQRILKARIKNDFGIRTDGVKITKVMSRVLDKVLKDADDKKPHIVAEVKKAIEKVGDSMKTKVVTDTVKISVELFDYLRMSHGNSWDSCHSIRDGGSWQSGTVSYALDKFTAIAYIEGSDGDLITRCCLHLHPKGIIIGRNYGSKNKESIIKAVQMLLDTDSRVDNFNCENIRRGGTAYADWRNDDGYNTLIELPLPIDVSEGYGAKPICIDCGNEHWEDGSLLCDSCTHVYCEHCGEEIDEDDAIWVDGRRVCTHCASYCNHCDEWHLSGNMMTGTDSRGRTQEFCQSCYDETQCICEDCGESMHTDLMYYHEGDYCYYCENCTGDHSDEDEEEEHDAHECHDQL